MWKPTLPADIQPSFTQRFHPAMGGAEYALRFDADPVAWAVDPAAEQGGREAFRSSRSSAAKR